MNTFWVTYGMDSAISAPRSWSSSEKNSNWYSLSITHFFCPKEQRQMSRCRYRSKHYKECNSNSLLPERCAEVWAAAGGNSGSFWWRKVRNQPGNVALKLHSSHPDPQFPDSWWHRFSCQWWQIPHFIQYRLLRLTSTHRKCKSIKFGLVSSTSLKMALAWGKKETDKCWTILYLL